MPFPFLLPYGKKGQQKGAFYIRSFVKIIKLRHLKKVFDKFYNNSYTLIKSLVDLLQTLLSTRDIYFTHKYISLMLILSINTRFVKCFRAKSFTFIFKLYNCKMDINIRDGMYVVCIRSISFFVVQDIEKWQL